MDGASASAATSPRERKKRAKKRKRHRAKQAELHEPPPVRSKDGSRASPRAAAVAVDSAQPPPAAGETACGSDGIGLARRKLTDEVMAGFLIGNTVAQDLLSDGDRADLAQAPSISLLFLGVGDIRNPLKTAAGLPVERTVAVLINDISVATLARDIVLLTLAGSRDSSGCAVALAVWSDALLPKEPHRKLQQTLRALVDGDLPGWLAPHDAQTMEACSECWRLWLAMELSAETVASRREESLRIAGSGHGRAGASRFWKEVGVSTGLVLADGGCSTDVPVARMRGNPTVFDPHTGQLLECQGPAGAFSSVEGLQPGTLEFERALEVAWRPLFDSLRARIARGTFQLGFAWGDCTVLMRQPALRRHFDAVDTSNLQDYVGLWNLLVCAQPCLRGGRAFVRTECILGVATTVDGMLSEEFPHGDRLHATLAHLTSLSRVDDGEPGSLQAADDGVAPERIVRAKWYLAGGLDERENGHSASAQAVVDAMTRAREGVSRAIAQSLSRLQKRTKGLAGVSQEQISALANLSLPELRQVLDAQENVSALVSKRERHEGARALAAMYHGFLDAEPAEEDTVDSICTRDLLSVLELAVAPRPMEADMLDDVRKPLLQSYPFPKSTLGTFVQLLVTIGRGRGTSATPVLGGGVGKFVRRLLADSALGAWPNARNRTLGLRILVTDCAPSLALAPKDLQFLRGEGLLFSEVALRHLRVSLHKEVIGKFGGVFEPALALFLVRDDLVLGAVTRRSGKYASARDSGNPPSNVLHEWLEAQNPKKVQVIDNVNLCFSGGTDATLSFLWPKDDAGTPSMPRPSRYEYAVLVDVQQYRIVCDPVPLGANMA